MSVERLAEQFMQRMGLNQGDYQIAPEHNGYIAFYFPEPNPKNLKFGSVGLVNDGMVSVYSSRYKPEYDPRGGFQTHPTRASTASHKPQFAQDDEDAWRYCAEVVRRGYDANV